MERAHQSANGRQGGCDQYRTNGDLDYKQHITSGKRPPDLCRQPRLDYLVRTDPEHLTDRHRSKQETAQNCEQQSQAILAGIRSDGRVHREVAKGLPIGQSG